jgi:hypothetical protein
LVSYESGPKRFKAKRALKDVYEYLGEKSFAQETSEVAIKPGTKQLIQDKIKHLEIKLKMAKKRALRTRTRMKLAIRETNMAKYDILEDSRIFYRKSIQRRKTIYLSFFSSTSCQDFMRRWL